MNLVQDKSGGHLDGGDRVVAIQYAAKTDLEYLHKRAMNRMDLFEPVTNNRHQQDLGSFRRHREKRRTQKANNTCKTLSRIKTFLSVHGPSTIDKLAQQYPKTKTWLTRNLGTRPDIFNLETICRRVKGVPTRITIVSLETDHEN